MSDRQSSTLSLLEDLEAIQKSLKKVAESSTEIPTLDEVVDSTPPKSLNPENPFLSSSSLSELIRIRNEAEERAARELAGLGRIKSLDEILAPEVEPEIEIEPEPERGPQAPDPEEIIAQMETLFHTWVDHSVKQYLKVFESELRNHLQQDFRALVTNWYKDHELPIPDSFQTRELYDDDNGIGDLDDDED